MGRCEDGQDVRWWRLPAAAILLSLLLTVPFWCSDLDLRIALAVLAWNDDLGGDQARRWWWQIPYYLPAVLSLVLGLGALAAVVGGLLRPERGWLRAGLFLLLSMAIGCGLVTNLVLKDHWGRPRPRDTVQLGGGWDYQVPWEKGTAGRGKSFPCGHATVPALGFALWLLWRRRRPGLARWSLAAGAVLTAWVAAARMVAQAHWLSDVLWAVAVMIVVPSVLYRLLMIRSEPARGPPRHRLRWPVLLGGGVAAAGLVCAVLLATPFFREVEVRSGREAIGPGPWRLEVVADVAEVAIELRQGAALAVRVDGEVQGFGMPWTTVTRRFHCGDGVARVELAVAGLLTEHSASLRLVVDPADLAAIDVQVGAGDVVVQGPSGASHIAVTATTREGDVLLPQGWR